MQVLPLVHHLKLTSPVLGDYETDSFPISVGRSSGCDFVIPNAGVSRIHAQIFLEADRCVLYDEGSANGTFVDSQKVADSAELKSGMRIQFGTCDFIVDMTIDSSPGAGFDAAHQVTSPSSSDADAGDDYTEMLGRPGTWEQNVDTPVSDEVVEPPTVMLPIDPPPTHGFFATNWPWILVVLLGPVIAWAAFEFYG